VVREDCPRVPLPVRTLPGGLKCTVLSPGRTQLERLREGTNWEDIVEEAENEADAAADDVATGPQVRVRPMGGLNIGELADEPSSPDQAVANGSSIALLVEYNKRRCLLGADAHPDVLIEGIDRVAGMGNTLEVDVFKLPHHGSKANVTRELVSRVSAKTYVFSTDGSGQQAHPNDQAVARVIMYGTRNPLLAFNYRSSRNDHWDNEVRRINHAYRTVYPPPGEDGLVLDINELAVGC
jgi:hypothetical protein